MKIFWVSNVYPEALENVFLEIKHSGQEISSYQKLKAKVDASYINYFATGWCRALENIGYETENVIINSTSLQNLWLKEHALCSECLSLDEILLLQIKKYCPDILFVDDGCSVEFLKHVKNEISSIRLVIGWSGSAVALDPTKQEVWKNLDIVLCCAPESVSYLKKGGAYAVHMNHAFLPDRLPLVKRSEIHSDITFIGSVVRGKEYHLIREQLLLALSEMLPLEIYSPSALLGVRTLLKSFLAIGLYNGVHNSPKWIREHMYLKLPVLRKISKWTECPSLPVNYKLYQNMKRPVFGMEMFNVLYQSDVVLNIHADSSPEFASNMRLFEGTGVGSCLLTDYKKNMKELFIPDQEVVTYDSLEDCVEKAVWLRDHPKERKQIAAAGAKKCLEEHTYQNRAIEVDRIVKKFLDRRM